MISSGSDVSELTEKGEESAENMADISGAYGGEFLKAA